MLESSDIDLLQEYSRTHSEEAFRALVNRHIHMVHASAFRQTGCAHRADDVTQAVFIVLAEKAGSIPSKTVLAGWLFKATRYAVANLQRAENRRLHWEHKAAEMQPLTHSATEEEQVTPHLDRALEALPEKDRVALLLRYFENKSIQEIGRTLGTTEDAAKMRLSRALEKLRLIFRKQGMALPTTVLVGILTAQGAYAAPVGLASASVSIAVLHQTTTTTLPIVQTITTLMAQTQLKWIALASLSLLMAGGAGLLFQQAAQGDSTPGKPPAVVATANPDKSAGATVLVMRDTPSWNRDPDFEDAMTDLEIMHDVEFSKNIAKTRLEPYKTIIIPGGQFNSEFYKNYAANAEKFERFVTNGGTLVLELNGAEKDGIRLPLGVRMTKSFAKENMFIMPDHPISKRFPRKKVQANFASHGYLSSVPQNALVLATESTDGKPNPSRPTFVEYTFGKGRVIAACQCFHDRDGSGRGPLMQAVLEYAHDEKWFSAKP